MGISERLEREEQIEGAPLNAQGKVLSCPEAASGGVLTADEAMAPDALPKEIQGLIFRCMEGVEPLEEELRGSMPKKLNAVHVNLALLSAAGFRTRMIAQTLGLNQIYISLLLHHPYVIKIKSALLASRGPKVLDIKTRLEDMAEDLMELTYEHAMQSNDLKTVARVTFGMLDRAGYGPTSTVKNEAPTPAAATGNTLARLAQALEASERVDAQVMPGRTPSVPPHESVEAQAPLPAPAEHPDLRRVG
jgi:hypothetical protein